MSVKNKNIEVLRVEIAKLSLEPHDVLVINFPGKITSQEATHTAEVIHQLLPNTKVLISSDGTVFSIVSQSILCAECQSKV